MSERVKDNINEEVKKVDDKCDANESINNIVVKPIVNIDVSIEELEMECSPTLSKSKEHN